MLREIGIPIVKMSRTRKNFRLRLICWIILVSGRYFAIVTSEQKILYFTHRNMKLITFSMNSEFGIRDTCWKIRSVTFLLYMIGQTLKIPLVQGCMERSYSWRGTLNRESCNCYIRCREKSEETHVTVLVSRATVKNFSGVRLSRLGLTHWSSAWQRSCEINEITFSSTLYRDRSISWNQNAFSWSATYATVPIWFLDEEGCYSKKKKKKGSPRDISKTTQKHDFFNRNVTRNRSVITIKKETVRKKKKRKIYCKSWTLQVTLLPSDVLLVITHNFLSRLFHHLHLLIYYFISFDLHILFTDSVISLDETIPI